MNDTTKRIIQRFDKAGIRYKLEESYTVDFLDSESERIGEVIIREEQTGLKVETPVELEELEKIVPAIEGYMKKLKSLGYGDVIVIATSDHVRTYRARAGVPINQDKDKVLSAQPVLMIPGRGQF